MAFTFADAKELARAFAGNLSEGGVFIQTRFPPPVGQVIELTIELTGRAPLEAMGQVTWARRPEEGGGPSGIGVKFTRISDAGRAIIREIVAVNGPVFADPFAAANDAASAPAAEELPHVAVEALVPEDDSARPSVFELAALEGTVSKRIIGIDLGTAFSCAAYIEEGKPQIIPNNRGRRTFSSAVYIRGDNVIVGDLAWDRLDTHPQHIVHSWKRLIGRRFDSPVVRDAMEHLTYTVEAGPGGQAMVVVGDTHFTIASIAARVLYEIRLWTREHLGEVIEAAVITIPAFFTDAQRSAVRAAAALAGFKEVRLLSEPVAAALAYGVRRGLDQRVLVYDFGGGTFDVSVLEVVGHVFQVVATGGDAYLGGVDFDDRLVAHILMQFLMKEDINLLGEPAALARVRVAAERAKRDLSDTTQVRITLPYIARREGQAVNLDMTITREELESITGELVTRSIGVCDDVLNQAGLTVDDIDEVLLVGGMSRMPLIHRTVHEHFKKPPRQKVHPDEAVAVGASLFAASLGAIDSLAILDVVTMPVGVAVAGGAFYPVVKARTPLPAEATFPVMSVKDGQDAFRLDVYQGKGKKVADCEFLGTLEVSGIAPTKRGEVMGGVRFRLDAEGGLVLECYTRDGQSHSARLDTTARPTDPAAMSPRAEARGVGLMRRILQGR